MLYIVKGNKEPAAYDDLKGKTVAVVCISDATAYGPNSLAERLGKALSLRLARNVNRIKLVPYDEVQDWQDRNGWNEIDFQMLGNDLNAEMVVVLEMTNYSIHEGQTMFKGRSTITTRVYDIADGGEVKFVFGPEQYEFPKSHGRPAIGISEAQFETAYLTKVIDVISRLFYPYERTEAIGEDAWAFDSM